LNLSPPPRILLAAAPVSLEPLALAIGSEFATNVAHNIAQAKAELVHSFDLVVCGLYFDDSRMFDLLRHMKAEASTRVIPFLAVKATPGQLSATLLQGVEIACAALGAEKFVELSEWVRLEGQPAAHTRFRNLVTRILAD